MKAEDVRRALQGHFSAGHQAIMFEVSDGVGHNRRTARLADAIGVGFWESRGMDVEGFEIKVSRSDWIREVQMPAKSNAHFVRCDRWWLVTPRRRGDQAPIAKAAEIPGPWGWMEITPAGKCEVVKKAPKLVPSVQFDKAFAFALIRAAAKYDAQLIAEEVARRVALAETGFTQRVNAQAAQLANPRRPVVDAPLMGKLREAFGPSIDWLGDEKVVEAIKAVRALSEARRYEAFGATATALREAADKVQRAADALAGIAVDTPKR